MHTNTAQPRISVGKLAWGLLLLAGGLYAFVEAIDVLDTREIWRLWPLGLIFLGAANEIDALRARKSDGSYILLAVGIWMLAGTQHWFDLSMRMAFPVAVVVAGLFICIHAVVDDPNAVTKKKENEQ
jgi:Domain of unknown function (DUF5668)